MPIQKSKINDIINEIRDVFGDVPFPNHCGWNAALVMDDWIDDLIELMHIIKEKDIHRQFRCTQWCSIRNGSMSYKNEC